MQPALKKILETENVVVQQIKEMLEIFTGWETKNKYQIMTPEGQELGFMAEIGPGFMATALRLILKSHRPLEIEVTDPSRQLILKLSRAFFFFFSDLDVTDGEGKKCGVVKRRFGFIYKKYDLVDQSGNIFARVKSPLWKLWSFPIRDKHDQEVGMISKKWGGLLTEVFTDADKFFVQFPTQFTPEQKAVVFASAISIDMDFFDNNNN
jgi:uncharacterized protein YxjI